MSASHPLNAEIRGIPWSASRRQAQFLSATARAGILRSVKGALVNLVHEQLAASVADTVSLALAKASMGASASLQRTEALQRYTSGNDGNEAAGGSHHLSVLALEPSSLGRALTAALRVLLATSWRVDYAEIEARAGYRVAQLAQTIISQPGQRIIIGRRDRDHGRWQAALALGLSRGPAGPSKVIGYGLEYLAEALAFLPISTADYPIFLPGLLQLLESAEAQKDPGEDARVAVAYLGVGWHGLGRRLRRAEILDSNTQKYLLDFVNGFSCAPRMRRLLGEPGEDVARLGFISQEKWLNREGKSVITEDCSRNSINNFAVACDILEEGYWKCYYADAHS